MGEDSPFLNVLIRTSDRPNHFRIMLDSIESQTYRNYKLHISVDTEFSAGYVVQSGYQPTIVEKVFKANNRTFPYNLYLNRLIEDVSDGWVMYMDDDDCYSGTNAFETIASHLKDENSLYIWRMRYPGGKVIPEDEYFGKLPFYRRHVGGECFAFHSKWKDIAIWDANKASDFRLISKLSDILTVEWIDFIAVTPMNNGSFGRKIEKILI